MLVVGLDIGGANLKAATSDGDAVDRPFPLWKQPDRLAAELAALLAELPRADGLAVTMTGELADCYATKPEGVRSILAAVTDAAAGRPVVCWQTGGEFLTTEDATELPELVAAANWHALATFCGRAIPYGPGVLFDVGSTTTDVIPLQDGMVAAEGLTDLERLRAGELVYTGALRTPVCALGPDVTINGRRQPLAAEVFATLRDVYLILGDLAEDAGDCDTADGRPATIACARQRLARMVCADRDELGDAEIDRLARSLADRQLDVIEAALSRVLARIEGRPAVLISGSGTFIAQRIVERTPVLFGADVFSLTEMFARRVSRSACAFAVARLAVERADFSLHSV